MKRTNLPGDRSWYFPAVKFQTKLRKKFQIAPENREMNGAAEDQQPRPEAVEI